MENERAAVAVVTGRVKYRMSEPATYETMPSSSKCHSAHLILWSKRAFPP